MTKDEAIYTHAMDEVVTDVKAGLRKFLNDEDLKMIFCDGFIKRTQHMRTCEESDAIDKMIGKLAFIKFSELTYELTAPSASATDQAIDTDTSSAG